LVDPCTAAGDEAAVGPIAASVADALLAEAEASYRAESWETCGELFGRVARVHPDAARRDEAAYTAMLCQDALLRAAVAETRGLEPRALTPLEESFASAAARFLCRTPESPDVPTVAYRRARIYYQANHWESAALLFRDLVEREPAHELAPYAANLYLDCLNAIGQIHRDRRESCREVLESEVDRLLEIPELTRDEELWGQLQALRCAIERSRAEAAAAAGRHLAAAQAYLRLYRERAAECDGVPSPMDEVLHDAAAEFDAAGEPGRASEVRSLLSADFPESPLAGRGGP
jgi:hypothetical protein